MPGIERHPELRIIQRHRRGLALLIDHGPLHQSERVLAEYQRQRAQIGPAALDQRDADVAAGALEPGHGDIAAETDRIAQEEPCRGLPQLVFRGLVQFFVPVVHALCVGEQRDLGGRVILEAHAAGTHDPEMPGAGPIAADLLETRGHCTNRVQIGRHALQLERVLRGQLRRSRDRRACRGRKQGQQRRREQVTAEQECLHGRWTFRIDRRSRHQRHGPVAVAVNAARCRQPGPVTESRHHCGADPPGPNPIQGQATDRQTAIQG